MTALRRLVPWIASLLAHAGLLLVPVGISRAPSVGDAVPRRVVLVFDEATAPGVAGPADRPAAEQPPSPLAPAPRASLPETVRVPDLPSADLPGALAAAAARPEASGSLLAAPPPLDVLASLPSASSAPAVAAAAAAAADSAASLERIGWADAPRTVLRRVAPRFPAVLSAAGQEVDVEARISVSPLGAVVDVEITRSSGYTEIDAGVEAALRQYVFSRAAGKQNAVGTVSFRFRLEKP